MTKKLERVSFRRRRERKTDYHSRISLLKSRLPRIIIRKTNKYIIMQLVESKEAQDSTIGYANSSELKKLGWSYSFKNLPAAYLTGFLIAKKSEEKAKEAVLDIGLQRSTKGSRIYAAIKGAIDGGLKIKCSEEMLPSDERIKGQHLKTETAKNIDKKIGEIKEKIKKM
ncbi:MAG: 50S ribosomal protein L18 [Candidatus Pacearchaeota archaeon]